MQVRQLAAGDAEAYWQLRLRMLREHPAAFGSSYEESAALSVAEAVRQFCARNLAPYSRVGGAFDGGTLVGTTGYFREHGAKSQHKAMIWGVYVAPEHRGRGAGRDLMEHALAAIRAWPDVELVRISVASDNSPALALYRSLGFQVYGHEPHALKVGARYVDEDHLVLLLGKE